MTDLECYWRSGKTHSLRRLPSHVRLHIDTDWRDVAMMYARLCVRGIVVGALLVIVYGVAL